jgi:nitrogen fixation protein NifX
MTVQRRLKVVTSGADAMGIEQAIKVAFASSDMRHVDQHFGAAEAFVVHAVDREQASLLEVVQFGRLDMDGNEDKLAAKIAALDGCVAVYCQAVGASAVNQLRAKDIHPVKVPPGTEVAGLIDSLQCELREGPSAWLARAILAQRPQSAERFDAMESEGWSE